MVSYIFKIITHIFTNVVEFLVWVLAQACHISSHWDGCAERKVPSWRIQAHASTPG